MSYLFANQRGQIWRNKVHLGTQIAVQHLTKFRQGNNTTGKLLDVDKINWRYIHPCTYVNASQDNSCGWNGVPDPISNSAHQQHSQPNPFPCPFRQAAVWQSSNGSQ